MQTYSDALTTKTLLAPTSDIFWFPSWEENEPMSGDKTKKLKRKDPTKRDVSVAVTVDESSQHMQIE